MPVDKTDYDNMWELHIHLIRTWPDCKKSKYVQHWSLTYTPTYTATLHLQRPPHGTHSCGYFLCYKTLITYYILTTIPELLIFRPASV